MGMFSLNRMKSAALGSLAGSSLPIAIDFGASSLKVLQLAAGDPPTLIAAAALETPDALLGDPAKRFQFQCQALPRMIKAAGFKGKRAMASIPAASMYCKHMQFPRAEGAALEEMVKQAVPSALNIGADQLILRHFAVEGARTPGSASAGAGDASGPKQEVICLAVSRELVGRMLEAIRDAKLEPVGIHPECVATIRAFEHITRRLADATLSSMYLDVANSSTKVWITHGQSLVFAKVIQMGGHDLDMAVARAMDLKLADARAKRIGANVLVGNAEVSWDASPSAQSSATKGAYANAAARFAASGSEEPHPGPPPSAPFLQSIAGQPTSAVAEDRRTGKLAAGLTPGVLAMPRADVAPPEFDLQVPLESLTDEIAMCVRYYESMFPGRKLERAIFYGGESRHRGLAQAIARRLRTQAHVADPLARIGRVGKETCLGVNFGAAQPGWTVPFGLSLCSPDL